MHGAQQQILNDGGGEKLQGRIFSSWGENFAKESFERLE